MKKFGRFSVLFLAALFVFAACGGGSGGGEPNILETMTLTKTEPSAEVFTAVGLNKTQFDEILSTVSGGYQGYEAKDSHIEFVWTGRGVNDFTKMAAYVESKFDPHTKGSLTGEGGLYGVERKDDPVKYWNLMYCSVNYAAEEVRFPAGIMMFYFENNAP